MAKTSKTKTSKAKTSKAKTSKAKTATRASKAKAPAGKSNGNRPPAEVKLAELKRRLREISDLNAASSLLEWDHATYMPTGGAAARARQGAMLRTLAHERSIDPALGKLIDELAGYADGLPRDSDDASLIRVAERDFAKAIT